MKKNAMLKIAAILLVAVLLTTCAISSTFAKYTTSGKAVTGATVARWGVEVDTTITDLFAESYAKDSTSTTIATTVAKNADYDPAAATEGDLVDLTWERVAPGTNGKVELGSLITGKPEVAVSVSLGFDIEIIGDWTAKADADATAGTYCPIVFYVKTASGTTYFGMKDMAYDGGLVTMNPADINALETAIEDAVNALIGSDGTTSVEFDANTDLGSKFTSFEFGWEWVFETSTSGAANSNYKDSTLADGVGTVPAITVKFAPTINQID